MLIHFIIPAYNEEKILENSTTKLLNFLKNQTYTFDWKLVLLINGSSDKSEEIAIRMSESYKEIIPLILKEKGKGNALKTVLDKEMADFSFYMDVDLAVSLENINDIIKGWKEDDYGLFIGSRLKKGAITDRSFFRELSSRAYILISKTIIDHHISDLQCGFKGIKKETWKKLSPFIKDNGWFFDTELLLWASILNLKIKEIPVNWSENRYEKRKSKVRLFRDSLDFSKKLLKLKKEIKKKTFHKVAQEV